MNADLYTVLLLLSCVGLFLAIVVGRLQFAFDDDLQKEVADKLQAVKGLEEDYRQQSEVREKLGAGGRSEILPMIGRSQLAQFLEGEMTPGRLFRRALAIYEAIEHVDDADNSDKTYQRTVQEFGLDGPSELHRADLRSMLRLARISIHARTQGEPLDLYKERVVALIENGNLSLSEAGKLRLREVLILLNRDEMQALTDEYRDYIPVIEDLLLSGSDSESNSDDS